MKEKLPPIACSFNCRDNAGFSVSASNKLLCNLTVCASKSATKTYRQTVMRNSFSKPLSIDFKRQNISTKFRP